MLSRCRPASKKWSISSEHSNQLNTEQTPFWKHAFLKKKVFLNLSPWFVPWWIISNDSLQIGKLLNTNKENGKSKRSGIILYRISKLCSCEVDLYRRWSYASCWSAKCEAFRFLSIHTLAIWKSEGRKEPPLQIHAFKVHLTWKWTKYDFQLQGYRTVASWD